MTEHHVQSPGELAQAIAAALGTAGDHRITYDPKVVGIEVKAYLRLHDSLRSIDVRHVAKPAEPPTILKDAEHDPGFHGPGE
jgi:hypothetical protein